VGFIRDLPHGLVDAFEATLQEACEADLLMHVIDAASPQHIEQIAQVQKVLAEIGAAEIPQILIFNKWDAMPMETRPDALLGQFELQGKTTPRLYVSATTGKGIPELRGLLLDWVKSTL
jgi:GTPase